MTPALLLLATLCMLVGGLSLCAYLSIRRRPRVLFFTGVGLLGLGLAAALLVRLSAYDGGTLLLALTTVTAGDNAVLSLAGLVT